MSGNTPRRGNRNGGNVNTGGTGGNGGDIKFTIPQWIDGKSEWDSFKPVMKAFLEQAGFRFDVATGMIEIRNTGDQDLQTRQEARLMLILLESFNNSTKVHVLLNDNPTQRGTIAWLNLLRTFSQNSLTSIFHMVNSILNQKFDLNGGLTFDSHVEKLSVIRKKLQELNPTVDQLCLVFYLYSLPDEATFTNCVDTILRQPVTWTEAINLTSNQYEIYQQRQAKQAESAESTPQMGFQAAQFRGKSHDEEQCRRCGKTNHHVSECSLPRDVECNGCGKIGHITTACWSKGGRNQRGNNNKHRRKFQKNNNRKGKGNQKYAVGTAFMATTTKKKATEIYLDSGCTRTLTNQRTLLSEFNARSVEHYQMPDGTVLYSKGSGTLNLPVYDADHNMVNLEIRNVNYVPDAVSTLIGMQDLLHSGYKATFELNQVFLHHENGEYSIPVESSGNMFKLNYANNVMTAKILANKETHELLHARMGHVGKDRLIKTMTATNLAESPGPKHQCTTCSKSGITKQHIGKNQHLPRSTKPREVCHADVAGPFTTSAKPKGGLRYSVNFTDDFTGITQCYFAKDLQNINQIIADWAIDWQGTNRSPARIYLDNAQYFLSEKVQNQFRTWQWSCHTCAPYRHETHGKIESVNKQLLNTTRALLEHAKLPETFWPFAYATACYLRNRTVARDKTETPFEMHYGVAPDLRNLRVFGCKVIYKDYTAPRKLNPRGGEGIFLGYVRKGSFGTYRIYCCKTKRIIERRDVDFFESELPGINNANQEQKSPPPTQRILETQNENKSGLQISNYPTTCDHGCPLELTVVKPNEELMCENCLAPITPGTNVLACPKHDFDVCAVCHDCCMVTTAPNTTLQGVPASNTKIQGVRSETKITNFAFAATKNEERELQEEILQQKDVPRTLEEAMVSIHNEKWKEAIRKEWEALMEMGTFKKVSIKYAKENTKKIMTARWVFTIKRDGRFKARCVVRGFEEPIEKNEKTYSPTPHLESLRILITIGLTQGFNFASLDFSNAFLNALIKDKTLCMYAPDGITIEDGYCLQLLKTLYGLSSSPIRWKELIVDEVLIKEYGLKKVNNEDCLLIGDNLYVLIYVDDIKLTGTEEAIDKLVIFLQKRFKVTKESNTSYLGINITKSGNGLCVHQEPAINKIIKEYGMQNAKGKNTPLPHNNALPILEKKQEREGYRRLVGKLMYLLATRPDLSFTMKELSRYNDASNEEHWNAAKGVLSYLKAHPSQGLLLKPITNDVIIAFTDASYAEELDSRKSTTGKIIYWGDNVISYKSKTQPLVTMSSFEAELVAISSVALDIVWLRNVLEELGYKQMEPSIIYTDSQSVIKWIESGKSASRQRSKHIDVRAHKILELVNNKTVILRYVSTEDNIADAFTKSLGRTKFNHHMSKVLHVFQD